MKMSGTGVPKRKAKTVIGPKSGHKDRNTFLCIVIKRLLDWSEQRGSEPEKDERLAKTQAGDGR